MYSERRTGVSKVILGLVVVLVVAVAAASAYVYDSSAQQRPSHSPLIVYSADAYAPEVAALESSFSSATGLATTPPKAGGSLTLARQIAQGNPVSVFVSVSREAVTGQYLKNQSAGWAVAFATDQMAVAYSNSSSNDAAAQAVLQDYRNAVTTNSSRSWYSFFYDLSSGAVKVGISDPNGDPAGYRAWLVLEASGSRYANSTNLFAERLLQNKGNVTSSSAAELVGPLQSGQIQFLFIYRSAAVSHGLQYLQLPSAVNLGAPGYSSFYARFAYRLSTGTVKGAPIVLFITVPSDSTNYQDSLRFVGFVVQNAPGVSKFGLAPLSPPRLYNDTQAPQQLAQLISQGSLAYGGPL